MKLLKLDIRNVRGIQDLSLNPDGKNCVVWGPNGAGKSAVVDAIDFLLTGRISRLTGKGTGGITLAKYGSHIDHDADEAVVTALVQWPGLAKPVKIQRCMARPSVLECDKGIEQAIAPILALARRGQHLLTRREILKYITAEAGTRAQEIQEVLNITEIEDCRRALGKVRNDLKRDVKAAKSALKMAEGAVNATVQSKSFNEARVLQVVNENRAVLGGRPISVIAFKDLKSGLKPSATVTTKEGVNLALVVKDMQNLYHVMSEDSWVSIAASERELRSLAEAIRSDPQLLKALSRLQLIERGIPLIDESGSCPLCDTSWPPGKLRKYLEQRLSQAQVAAQHQKRMTQLSEEIANSVNNAAASLQKVIAVAEASGLRDKVSPLESWLRDLEELSAALDSPMQKYPVPRFGAEEVQRLLAPMHVIEVMERFHAALKTKYPEATPEQTAWDTLTRLEENLKGLELAGNELELATLWYGRAATLLQRFLETRDAVLGKLYDQIRDRFEELYTELHGEDEEDFAARIAPEGAGLDLEVDFYGREMCPPNALHSEGHQDSMGVCLYLALAEQLTQGLIDLVVLDDVLMSVDTGHRKQLCRILSTHFPNRQFLITTHDRTWANQLRTAGVVNRRGTVEFHGWSLETGPIVDFQPEMWNRIDEDLERNDVPAAAAKLRRGSEEFFRLACDALGALVVFKLDQQFELGELLPAAIRRYRDLVGQAKDSANSWNNREALGLLKEVDKGAKAVFARTDAERWAVNANVHYNNWAKFSVGDFRPVVEAFRDLYAVFMCSECGGTLYIAHEGRDPVALRCSCGRVNWNLAQKQRVK